MVTAAHQALTPAVIKASFRNVHLYPFDREQLIDYCVEKAGLKIVEVPQHERAENYVAQLGALHAISVKGAQAVVAAAKENAEVATAVTPVSRAFSARRFLAMVEQNKENDARAAAVKEAKAEQERQEKRKREEDEAERRRLRTCQRDGCARAHRNATTGFLCECGAFYVCQQHHTRTMAGAIDAHKAECGVVRAKRPRRAAAQSTKASKPMRA
jgi:hypothetical protein